METNKEMSKPITDFIIRNLQEHHGIGLSVRSLKYAEEYAQEHDVTLEKAIDALGLQHAILIHTKLEMTHAFYHALFEFHSLWDGSTKIPKEKLKAILLGKMMKASKGKANPTELIGVIEESLNNPGFSEQFKFLIED